MSCMEGLVLIAYRIHTLNTTMMIVGKTMKLLLSRNKKFLSYVGTKSLQKWNLPSSHYGLNPLYLTFLGSSQHPVSVWFPGALEAFPALK